MEKNIKEPISFKDTVALLETTTNQRKALLDGYIQLLNLLGHDVTPDYFKRSVREIVSETLEKHNSIQ